LNANRTVPLAAEAKPTRFTSIVRRVAIRVLVEAGRLVFAAVVGLGCAIALESTCPPPTPENSSPGCEGPSYVVGGFLGFVGASGVA